MKNHFLKFILFSITLFSIISCENESDEDLLLSQDNNIVVPKITPNDDLSSLDFDNKSSENQPFIEYWERLNDGITSFERTGNFTIDGEVVIDKKVTEKNLRNYERKVFITWHRGTNYIYMEKDGLSIALPLWNKEKYARAYWWNKSTNQWITWREFKYRAYTNSEYRQITVYNSSRPIPSNWIRYSSSTTGGNSNVVGYIGNAVHRSTLGIHPTATVPNEWILYSSSSDNKIIRFLGVPEVGDTTTTRMGNLVLPNGWRYIGSETTAIGIVLYTIKYLP
ncbi:hypothetical protein [Aquimarina sp. SS2-1]|uniref:hypothetical protein n=1 Tax=Aquimarina besae TaxID=3342247 RepID=UPI003671875B